MRLRGNGADALRWLARVLAYRPQDQPCGARAWRFAVGQSHQRVETPQRRDLRGALGCIFDQRNKRRRQIFRRTFALQDFRYGALAKDEIGQQDRGNFDDIFELFLDERDLVGADGRRLQGCLLYTSPSPRDS